MCAPLPAPEEEARALFNLVGKNGDTVETVRGLIGVSPAVEAALRAYAETYPEEREGTENILRFRARVREEFEKLVADNGTATTENEEF